jgi:hypothetical protein
LQAKLEKKNAQVEDTKKKNGSRFMGVLTKALKKDVVKIEQFELHEVE